jgi:hypothetical protein
MKKHGARKTASCFFCSPSIRFSDILFFQKPSIEINITRRLSHNINLVNKYLRRNMYSYDLDKKRQNPYDGGKGI